MATTSGKKRFFFLFKTIHNNENEDFLLYILDIKFKTILIVQKLLEVFYKRSAAKKILLKSLHVDKAFFLVKPINKLVQEIENKRMGERI